MANSLQGTKLFFLLGATEKVFHREFEGARCMFWQACFIDEENPNIWKCAHVLKLETLA